MRTKGRCSEEDAAAAATRSARRGRQRSGGDGDHSEHKSSSRQPCTSSHPPTCVILSMHVAGGMRTRPRKEKKKPGGGASATVNSGRLAYLQSERAAAEAKSGDRQKKKGTAAAQNVRPRLLSFRLTGREARAQAKGPAKRKSGRAQYLMRENKTRQETRLCANATLDRLVATRRRNNTNHNTPSTHAHCWQHLQQGASIAARRRRAGQAETRAAASVQGDPRPFFFQPLAVCGLC